MKNFYAIYIRTSTEEQNPENQLKDILSIVPKNLVYHIYKDQQSAWKDHIQRNDFNKLKNDIKAKKINDLYVWDLDRLYRNRRNLIDFFTFCKLHNCKIYSYRQIWLQQINNIPSPFDEIMHDLMLQIMGWLAEEESNKRSERVKLAVRKKDHTTISYKGNKWGRKSISRQVKDRVIESYKRGKTIREIASEIYYWDKSNNKKQLSKSVVHKIIMENRGKNDS